LTLELIEEHPSGEVGFEGTVQVSKSGGENTNGLVSARATA
jgi:3-methylfumaryl-CoA hydratase